MAEILTGEDAAAARRLEDDAVRPVLHGASCPVLVVTESRDHVAPPE
jgi:hypothetical protein